MTEYMNERDPSGLPPGAPGAKLDLGKAPLMRGLVHYFPRACYAVSGLSLVGAEKYSWKGWEKVDDGVNRYGDAEMRHVALEEIEGLYDKAWLERGKYILHATASAWNALAKLELILRNIDGEARESTDRQGTPEAPPGAAETDERPSGWLGAAREVHLPGEDAQHLPGRDGRYVVQRPTGPVGGVEVGEQAPKEAGQT